MPSLATNCALLLRLIGEMGYYGPTFGGLDRGWYFKTTEPNYAEERDACLKWWNAQCDSIVESYLLKYGMFVSAFEREIKADIRSVLGEGREFPRYFGYFFVSRVLQEPRLERIYRSDHESRSRTPILCTVCDAAHTYDDIHPSLIGRTKKVLPLCNKCWFWLATITPLEGLESVSDNFKEWIRGLSKEQSCRICGRNYIWVKKDVRYSFEVPLLPSRHTEICPHCIQKAVFGGPEEVKESSHLRCFKQISDLIGAVPNRSGFVYDQIESLEVAIEVTRLMFTIPSFERLEKHCGSWFKLLVASGVLPEGTRKTHFGTMVLAKDGHECLSLAEKTIDDLLHEHHIAHEKEPHYPGSDYRADWKIAIRGVDVLIELFGLDGQPSYMKRMRTKLAYAESVKMAVIAFDRNDLKHLRHAFQKKILSQVQASKTP